MLQLDSKEYENHITVTLRDESIKMPFSNGIKLMGYLTSDNTSSHVMLTTIDNEQIVVNKNDIRKVSPVQKRVSHYKTPEELGLTATVDVAEGDGYSKFQEMRRKAVKSL